MGNDRERQYRHASASDRLNRRIVTQQEMPNNARETRGNRRDGEENPWPRLGMQDSPVS